MAFVTQLAAKSLISATVNQITSTSKQAASAFSEKDYQKGTELALQAIGGSLLLATILGGLTFAVLR